MAIEKFFIKEGIREAEIEEYLAKKFERADYSRAEIQRTPLGTRIVVYVNKPGLVIGKSGRIIKDLTEDIKTRFQLENPMLDVKEIDSPYLDAQVVATRIAKSIERGSFYKKTVNFYLQEIMRAGAIGVEIKVGGKLGGERGRFQKFREGYIKHSGYYADNLLQRGMATAKVKLGIIGVQVRILTQYPDDLSIKRSVMELTAPKEVEPTVKVEAQPEAEKPKKEEKAEKAPKEVEKVKKTVKKAKKVVKDVEKPEKKAKAEKVKAEKKETKPKKAKKAVKAGKKAVKPKKSGKVENKRDKEAKA
ncbi:30S ribosomal protein S3 [Candidatus Micrarchaeota archaeon RBG_16_49_10]|nr:MAG: 30S ribosomal protein S3 [Candidatus Micrarchaeota archaeon RBG_16_49_10]